MKLTFPAIVFAVLLFSGIAFATPMVSAQSTQVTATVNLNYLNIQVTFPSEIFPGNSTTAHVQATAKSSFYLSSLTAQVFYADGSSIKQLLTKTLASDRSLSSGQMITADVQITVPQNAPRTSLVAAFSENARVTSYYSTSYKYYYYPSTYTNYYYPYMYYYTNYSYPYYYYCYGYGCSYPSTYYPYYSTYSSYPTYYYSYTTDVGITSMPYIKANTPEQMSLQSEVQQLQQQLAESQANNQQLQQQLGQSQSDNQRLQSENQQLQQQVQSAQQTINQQNATAASLNEQLSSNRNLTYGLGGLVAILAGLAIHYRGKSSKATSQPQQQYAQQQYAATEQKSQAQSSSPQQPGTAS